MNHQTFVCPRRKRFSWSGVEWSKWWVMTCITIYVRKQQDENETMASRISRSKTDNTIIMCASECGCSYVSYKINNERQRRNHAVGYTPNLFGKGRCCKYGVTSLVQPPLHNNITAFIKNDNTNTFYDIISSNCRRRKSLERSL